MKTKNFFFLIIKTIVSITLLFFLFKMVDYENILEKIKWANMIYFSIPIFVSFLGIYLSVLKRWVILNAYNINFKKIYLYKIYIIWSFYNNFLPWSIWWDGYKYIELNKKNISKSTVIWSMLLERGLGYLSIFPINIILSIVFLYIILNNKSLLLIEIFILLIFFTIVIFYIFKKYLLKILNTIQNDFIKKIMNFIKLVMNLKDKNKVLIYSLFLSVLFSSLSALSLRFIFYGFWYNISFFYLFFASSVVRLSSIVPISLNNIWISEGIYVFIFSIIWIDSSVTFTVAIIWRFLMILSSSFWWLLPILDNINRLKE